MWYSMLVTLLSLSPPPCLPGDLDRFPPSIHTEAIEIYANGECEGCYMTGCPPIDPRMAWLKAQRGIHPREWIEWDEQITEQENIEATWTLLWRARVFRHPKFYSTERCVEALQELRDRIGEENYALGRMPSPVPLHRYVEVGR